MLCQSKRSAAAPPTRIYRAGGKARLCNPPQPGYAVMINWFFTPPFKSGPAWLQHLEIQP
jgi:hypothetical protein